MTAVVEGLAFATEKLSEDDRVIYILSKRTRGDLARSLATDTVLAFSLSMLHRYETDWEANGFDEDGLGELAFFNSCTRI